MAGGQNVTAKDHENTRRLKEYWSHGEGAAKIKWGTEGDLTRCHRLVGEATKGAMTSEQIWGFCQNRHQEALGTSNAEHDKAAGHGRK